MKDLIRILKKSIRRKDMTVECCFAGSAARIKQTMNVALFHPICVKTHNAKARFR